MTKNEIRQCHVFPYAVDAAVTEKFGIECKTSYGLFLGQHATIIGTSVWDDVVDEYVDDPTITPELRKEVFAFIEGWKAGQVELRTRLQDKSLWL